MHFNQLIGNLNQVASTSRTPTPKPTNQGVKIEPFRGWRISTRYLEALAAQYATPWVQNGDHTHLTHTFNTWRSDGAIDQDMIPAIYVYEQTGPQGTLRGVLASTHLDSELLPHEKVIPERVDALTNLMRNTRINLDPVLLGFTGDGRTAACITRTTHERPVLEVQCRDGQSHRVWRTASGASAKPPTKTTSLMNYQAALRISPMAITGTQLDYDCGARFTQKITVQAPGITFPPCSWTPITVP